jgi:hypothetical protein
MLSDSPSKRQQQKVSKKPASSAPGATGGGNVTSKKTKNETQKEKDLRVMMASLDAPKGTEPNLPLSEEEKSRRRDIGRRYVIGRFEQHNEIDHDLTCKLYMKNHAVKMLPRGNDRENKLRYEAMRIDDSTDGTGSGAEYPPLWRHIAMWTPPIKGFDPTKFLKKNEEQ